MDWYSPTPAFEADPTPEPLSSTAMQLTGSLPSVSAALRYTDGLGLNRGGSKSLSPLCTCSRGRFRLCGEGGAPGRSGIGRRIGSSVRARYLSGGHLCAYSADYELPCTYFNSSSRKKHKADIIQNPAPIRVNPRPHYEKNANHSTSTLSAGKYSSSLQAVMDAGTLGLGLVVEMQNATPAAVRAANTWTGSVAVRAR